MTITSKNNGSEAGKKISAGEKAYRHVRDEIIYGNYADNTMLTEIQIAEELGMSRTPVREALLRLATENLLLLVPRRGALVRPISHSEWLDLVSVRILLESWSAKEIIKTQKSELIFEHLTQAITTMQEALEKSSLIDYVTADQSFHAAIIKGSSNQIVSEIYESLRLRQIRTTSRKAQESGFAAGSSWAVKAIDQHKSIAEAIKNNKDDVVESLLTDHLSSLLDAL